ncbi:MAG TPA: HAMP domain-containing sensor histidine kinase, partial [Pseudobdellovibrionaceae bacterium]|nr:HAMP domain-containing sensor histidine kinase [Pseudobdellovibrionaceae bacterium]
YLSMRELRHANQRLSLKNALISSLTHDLGNPLTTLLISVERLDVERRFDENVWGRLKKATQTLRSMVASVKFMHAVETGNASLHLASVSLSHAVSEALELVRGSLEAKGIQVVNEIEGLDLKVRADESTLVNNVLPNLLSNAIKFSVPGGKIYFRGRQTANETLLVIQDDGVGIPKEILKDFFDGGTILSRVGTSGEMGSGLGMLQVKTFMDLYHARIRMKSKTAEESGETGTRVTLIFQAVKESTEPKERL